MLNLWWVIFISVLVIAIFLLCLILMKIEKNNKDHQDTEKSNPTPSIDKSEIDLNSLYLKKMTSVGEKQFLEDSKTAGGNGKGIYHSL